MIGQGTLLVILFFLFLLMPIIVMGFLYWKRGQNLKYTNHALFCVFYGVDKVMARVIPYNNDGLLEKPAGKYLKKKERGKEIAWPDAGYAIPQRTPPIMWPLNSLPILQVPVGIAIYKVGNPRPMTVDDSFPEITAETISAIHENKVVQEVFKKLAVEMRGAQGPAKLDRSYALMLYLAGGGALISAILCFICLAKIGDITTAFNAFKALWGY